MSGWISFLSWLSRLVTIWTAYFHGIFRKPPPPEEHKCLEDNSISDIMDSRGGEVHECYLPGIEGFLSAISSATNSTSLSIYDGRYTWHTDNMRKEEKATIDHDAYLKILKGIASSTVRRVNLDFSFSDSSKNVLFAEQCCEVVLSNPCIKSFQIGSSSPLCSRVTKVLSKSLQESKTLESLANHELEALDIESAKLLGDALCKNRSLKRLCPPRITDAEALKLLLKPLLGGDESNCVLEKLDLRYGGHEDDGGEQIATMLRHNTSLKILCLYVGGATKSATCIGDALCSNLGLRGFVYMGGQLSGDGVKGLIKSLIPDSDGIQANTTLKELALTDCDIDKAGGAHLIAMLANNGTLSTWDLLDCRGAFEDPESVVQLFESLKTNKSLEVMSIRYCEGVRGQRVLGTIMDVLLHNHHLKKIGLRNTPLERDGGAEIVRTELAKRRKETLWEVVQGMASVTPNSGRVFLCGSPYAGKTTLRKTMTELCPKKMESRRKGRKLLPSFLNGRRDVQIESIEERTRGIEVHSLSFDDLEITVWDMAGQDEYHAFHDLVIPNYSGSGNGSSFILVCDPTRHSFRISDIEADIQYWLRFIVSNTRISASYQPHVMVVLTHHDQWQMEELFEQLMKEKVTDLKSKFEDLLEFDDNVFVINALSKKSIIPLFNTMKINLKALLERLPKIIKACTDIRPELKKWLLEHPSQPFMKWEIFSTLCDAVEDLKETQIDPQLSKRKKEFVAVSLHNAGQVIFYEDLDFIILHPHWFCHNIIGELIFKCKTNTNGLDTIFDGSITIKHLKMFFSTSLNDKGLNMYLDDMIQMMMKLEICYYHNHDFVMIPSLLCDKQSSLEWPSKENILRFYNYVGIRLAGEDSNRTALTLGFFPRLQVFLQRRFGQDNGKYNYKLLKDQISFVYNAVEVIIEYSGTIGFDIDILVRSPDNQDYIYAFCEECIIRPINDLCADPILGCQGVKLVEWIIRPSCVKRLVPRKQRRHQVVLVEDLKQMALARSNLQYRYNWPQEGSLDSEYDEAKTLLGRLGWEDVLNRRMDALEDIKQKLIERQPKAIEESTSVKQHCSYASKPLSLKGPEGDAYVLAEWWCSRLFCKMEETKDEILQKLNEMENRLSIKMDKILQMQEKLFLEVCARLDELMTFSKELQQSQVPRLAYLTECKENNLRNIATFMVPKLKNWYLHLMCEHKDGPHFMIDQKGHQVFFGTHETRVFLTIATWGLKILSILVKVGANIGGGFGTMIPDFGKDLMLLLDSTGILEGNELPIIQDLPEGIDIRTRFITDGDRKATEEWLIQQLDLKVKSHSIGKLFGLHKVAYRNGGGSGRVGSIAWICNKHLTEGQEGKSLDLLNT